MLAEMSRKVLMEPSEDQWNWIRDFIVNAQKILWISMPNALFLRGLSSQVWAEACVPKTSLKFYTLDIDSESSSDDQIISYILQVYIRILGPHASPLSEWEWEVAARGGDLLIPRLVPEIFVSDWVTNSVSKYHPRFEEITDQTRSLKLSIRSTRLWDTIYWKDHSTCSVPVSSLPPTHIAIRANYAAINFRDVMTAMGQISGSSTILMEGAGTVLAVGTEAST